MRMTDANQSLKWIWIAGAVIWLAAILLLSWRHYNAETFAQASYYSMRLVFVSLFGTLWGVAAALWQARQKKIGKREG
jgi:hypothetical protein